MALLQKQQELLNKKVNRGDLFLSINTTYASMKLFISLNRWFSAKKKKKEKEKKKESLLFIPDGSNPLR